MTRRPYSAGSAAAFLEDVLAGGGLGVHDLEARARAVGLLGEHQRISRAKMFISAKKALGISSVRIGRVVAVKSPPLTPSPPFASPNERTVGLE
jgi:hypothetical protein